MISLKLGFRMSRYEVYWLTVKTNIYMSGYNPKIFPKFIMLFQFVLDKRNDFYIKSRIGIRLILFKPGSPIFEFGLQYSWLKYFQKTISVNAIKFAFLRAAFVFYMFYFGLGIRTEIPEGCEFKKFQMLYRHFFVRPFNEKLSLYELMSSIS